MEAAEHTIYNLRNANVKTYPFPHFYVEKVFPSNFYWDLLESLPASDDYHKGDKEYAGRRFADPNDNPYLAFMKSKQFLWAMLDIFHDGVLQRFPDGKLQLSTDLRLVRDGKDYHIGPHTDAAWKMISLLFYLPPDDRLRKYGTSIYTPKDKNFRCPGGPHYPFEPFNLVTTAPFLPNTCFGFWKTDNSFHGVEPIDVECQRNVLLWNCYEAKPKP